MKRYRVFAFAGIVAALLVAGCNSGDQGTTKTVSSTQEQDYIKGIQNNPKIPAQAKAAAIKGMQEQQAHARQAAQVH
jgi:hypothetical protein